ncbi:FAD-binding oxidoreductase [Mesorhizobium sp. 8]|nr:FAD-binding oxidoreductase [Mesorhizobium sp. 8]
MSSTRIVVIGGGVAGLTAALALQEWASVTVIERESQLGYHASGRSAALFSESYGNAMVRALSRASREALETGGYFEHKRAALHFGGPDDGEAIDRFALEAQALLPTIRRLSAAEVGKLVPVFGERMTCGGVYEPDAMDIDTGKIVQESASAFRALGGQIRTGEEVVRIEPDGEGLRVETTAGVYETDTVVNAAGAWADVVAERAGLTGIGLAPKRRTAFIFDAPGHDVRNWPLVVDIHERFYFKPDAGRLIGSLADETDSPPCDAYPEDIDVAIAVDRIEQATGLSIGRPQSPWAGLRTFAPDGTPVAGADPRLPRFFWLAGQGGYGFQVSFALARLTSALLRDAAVPGDLAAFGVEREALAPDRFIATEGGRQAG